jgi:serine/threonine protein kinase
MSAYLSNSLILDGYRLIRFLGRGGFGEVWLCRSEAMGDYRALKFIPTNDLDRLEKEYEALVHYRKAAAQLRSPNLVPIEHANRNEAGLYYVMPLADGCMVGDPSDPAWLPSSLATRIQERIDAPTWFSSREITALLVPIVQGLQTLSDSGLVHRDVKPENILFFNGQACLGDISLLGADASEITRRGTPGYATPSWYVGGHPDMYGLAATLYALLTGNSPDRIGRAAFVWPPQGEASLSEAERVEWKRLHAVIRRASEEKIAERYRDFSAMARALTSEKQESDPAPSFPAPEIPHKNESGKSSWILVGIVAAVVLAVFLPRLIRSPDVNQSPQETVTTPPLIPPNSSSSQDPNELVPSADSSPNRKPDSGNSTARSPTSLAQRADGILAYKALTTMQGNFYRADNPDDIDDSDYMSFDENSLHQDVLRKIYDCLESSNEPDFPMALQLVDDLFQAVPRIAETPTFQLSRLLLQRAVDGRAINPAVLNRPAFLVLGNDDLAVRVALLCHLGAEQKADEFLVNYITRESRSNREKSKALAERARVRVILGRFADARADAEQALVLTEGNSALKSQRLLSIAQLQKDFPAYAAYLKSLPEK